MRLLMFPGQGSQAPGMGKKFHDVSKAAREAFVEASEGCGLDLAKLCFEGSEEDLKKTEVTQPAILTVSVAAFRALRERGAFEGERCLFAGHSLGEYSALVAMGALSLGEAARLVRHRGAYMQEAVPAGVGAMAALMFKPDVADGSAAAQQLCDETAKSSGQPVSVANFNSPQQIVISGSTAAVDAVCKLALATPASGVRKAVPLPVSAPFHCALMAPAAERLLPELNDAKWHLPLASKLGSSYIANVDAQAHDLSAPGQNGTHLALRLTAQITGSVQWVRSVRKAIELGATEASEIGPGSVLCGLIKRIQFEGRGLNGNSHAEP